MSQGYPSTFQPERKLRTPDLSPSHCLIPLVYLIQAVPQLRDFIHNEDFLIDDKPILIRLQTIIDNYLKCLSPYYNRDPPYNNLTVSTLLAFNSKQNNQNEKSSLNDCLSAIRNPIQVIRSFLKEFHQYYTSTYSTDCICHDLFLLPPSYSAMVPLKENEIPIYQFKALNSKMEQIRSALKRRTEVKEKDPAVGNEGKLMLLTMERNVNPSNVLSLIDVKAPNLFTAAELFNLNEDNRDLTDGYDFIGVIFACSSGKVCAYFKEEDQWMKYDDSSIQPKQLERQLIEEYNGLLKEDRQFKPCLLLMKESKFKMQELIKTAKEKSINSVCFDEDVIDQKKFDAQTTHNEITPKPISKSVNKAIDHSQNNIFLQTKQIDSLNLQQKPDIALNSSSNESFKPQPRDISQKLANNSVIIHSSIQQKRQTLLSQNSYQSQKEDFTPFNKSSKDSRTSQQQTYFNKATLKSQEATPITYTYKKPITSPAQEISQVTSNNEDIRVNKSQLKQSTGLNPSSSTYGHKKEEFTLQSFIHQNTKKISIRTQSATPSTIVQPPNKYQKDIKSPNKESVPKKKLEAPKHLEPPKPKTHQSSSVAKVSQNTFEKVQSKAASMMQSRKDPMKPSLLSEMIPKGGGSYPIKSKRMPSNLLSNTINVMKKSHY